MMPTKRIEPPWFVNCAPRKADHTNVRLFFFPFAGGSAASYLPLARQINSAVDVFAVQLPGRASRFNEPCVSDLLTVITQLTQAMLPLLDQPAVFFGHSMGAMLAYEVSCQLQRLKQPLPKRLMLSACSAPHVSGRDKTLHDLPSETFWREVKAMNGTPNDVLANPELLELIEPCLRADFQLVHSWRQQNNTLSKPVLPLPFELFAGSDDRSVSPAQVQEWARYSTQPSTLHHMNGDHFYLFESSAALSKILSTSLASLG